MPERGHSVGKVRIKKSISHGTGEFSLSQFASIGKDVIFETGVLVFHPENIEIGDSVYIRHYTILKGYYRNKLVIGEGSWIGQQCFFHAGGAGKYWIEHGDRTECQDNHRISLPK